MVNKDELISLNLNNDEQSCIKDYYTSEQLQKWRICEKNNSYIIYTNKTTVENIDNYPNIKKHLDQFSSIITSDNKPYGLHRARDEKFFLGEKIISKRKCQEPTFTYSNTPVYVSQTYNIIKTNRVDIKYLLGILNSNLIKFWLKNKGKMQGNNYQVDKEPLCEIPIVINSPYEHQLVDLVNNIIENNIECQNEIDEIVYKIYNIDADEIKKIEREF